MPVDAQRFVRRLPGGSQAHLLEADDGHYYVVKLLNNPQHRRILANEWLASFFLRFLGIATPEVAMVRISSNFIEQNPEAHIQRSNHREALTPGWHFGSRYPGDPMKSGVYDLPPDFLLGCVENIHDFLGVLAFDKWVSNGDSRQAVFFRTPLRPSLPGVARHSRHTGFVAEMVDNGHCFEGWQWRFTDSPRQGFFGRSSVYSSVRGLSSFEPWLNRIVNFPYDMIDRGLKQVPSSWLQDDYDEIERMLEKLMRRRSRVPDLIESAQEAASNPFPNWQ